MMSPPCALILLLYSAFNSAREGSCVHKKGLSRRQFIGAARRRDRRGSRQRDRRRAVSSGQAPPPAAAGSRAQPDATLVLTNGRIHTMDARNTIARTVSIRNGRFVTVGDTAPGRGRQHPRHRSQGTDGRARTHRRPHPHRQPGQPSRLSHDSREHDVDPRNSGSAGRAAEGRAGRASGSRRWAAGIRTSGPSIVIRRGRSSTRRFRIVRCCCTSDSPVRA